MHYELTEVDHVFVSTHSQKFKLEGNPVLTDEFLTAVFIELEMKAGKDPVIPRSKGWFVSYIERERK
jgi:hypothetical protein